MCPMMCGTVFKQWNTFPMVIIVPPSFFKEIFTLISLKQIKSEKSNLKRLWTVRECYKNNLTSVTEEWRSSDGPALTRAAARRSRRPCSICLRIWRWTRKDTAKKDETAPGDSSDATSTRALILERDLSLSGWRNIWLKNTVPNVVKSEDSYGSHNSWFGNRIMKKIQINNCTFNVL